MTFARAFLSVWLAAIEIDKQSKAHEIENTRKMDCECALLDAGSKAHEIEKEFTSLRSSLSKISSILRKLHCECAPLDAGSNIPLLQIEPGAPTSNSAAGSTDKRISFGGVLIKQGPLEERGKTPRVDIVIVHGCSYDHNSTWSTKAVDPHFSWFHESLPKRLEKTEVATNAFNYWRLPEDKEAFQETRQIVFDAHSLGGLIIKDSFGDFQEWQHLFDSTKAVYNWNGGRQLRVNGREITWHHMGHNTLPRRDWSSVLEVIGKKQRYGQVVLPTLMIACMAPIFNFEHDTSRGLFNHTSLPSFDLPEWIISPTVTIFVFVGITYGIVAMTYYHLNSHHKYQHPILLGNLVAGAAISMCLRRQDTSLNVLTTTMPFFMTGALILSAVAHLIVGERWFTEEEKVIRILDEWVEEYMTAEKNGIAEKA